MAETRRGFLLGLAAYAIWGAFPLYWPLLEPAAALEILGHRVVWSALVMVLLVVLLRRQRPLAALLRDRRVAGLLLLAAVVVTFNQGTYIWGVNNGHVVEASLGYFINPLVTVLMGVVILRERLRAVQWLALGIASLAVVILTVGYGRPPWVALILACSFGSYGLLKKFANAGAVESLTLENVALAPFALALLLVLASQDNGHFTGHGADHVALMVSSGVVTAVPLIFFGAAATRVPMTTLGLLQYVTPLIQFFIGVVVRQEDMSSTRWVGFALVWVALAVFTLESLANHRALDRSAEAVAV